MSSMSVGAVSSFAGRAHTSKCARSPLSFSPLAIRPLDIRRCPGHVIPLSTSPPRPGIGFQGKNGGGKKAEKDGARVFGEVRLPQTRRILRLFFPSPSPPFTRLPRAFFLLFSLPSDARLPSGCSYVHVSYRGTKDVGIDQSPPRLRK